MSYFNLVKHTGNRKTGPITISNSSEDTCAPDCPLKNNGCYAENHFTYKRWKQLSSGRIGGDIEELLHQLRRLPKHSLFRANVAGDLAHEDGQINRVDLQRLTKAVKRLPHSWTYTHHEKSTENLAAIQEATNNGFTINLSFENQRHAAEWHSLGYPSVCTVEGMPAHFKVQGVNFHQCPATYDKSSIQCETCGGGDPLCARADRNFVVTFPVHGQKRKAAAAVCTTGAE